MRVIRDILKFAENEKFESSSSSSLSLDIAKPDIQV
jgi:hypothetical protein